jgi:hypothetical protein
MGVWCIMRATFSTRQQHKIDGIIPEMIPIKAYYITNDSHGYLLLLGRKCYAYHASHTHVRAVVVCPRVLAGRYIISNQVEHSIVMFITYVA